MFLPLILFLGDDNITSYEFRNNPMFLRNQFKGVGMFNLPLVKKQNINLDSVELLGYDKLSENETDKIVHFFLDDNKFQSIYNQTDEKVETLKKFKAILTPDFSMYIEMPTALQLYSCFKNRWVGAYLQSKGVKVIPTVRWGNLESFNYCFDGIEKGSIVAVSTVGLKNDKANFMLGYNEMRRRIKPEAVICYGKPFEEMKGKIIEVDYAETNNLNKGYYVKKIYGYVESVCKGGGSASGSMSGNPKPSGSTPTGNSINECSIEDLPENVQESYQKYEKYGWKNHKEQSSGTKAGKKYSNRDHRLPETDSNGQRTQYYEYDVNNRSSNSERDNQRFVRDDNGNVYYTDDHYDTFRKIK